MPQLIFIVLFLVQVVGKDIKSEVFLSFYSRQHTSAFVPSSGRIYSFGLGGNGQLGTGSTSNRKSPFTVKGNWLPYNGQRLLDTGKFYRTKALLHTGFLLK